MSRVPTPARRLLPTRRVFAAAALTVALSSTGCASSVPPQTHPSSTPASASSLALDYTQPGAAQAVLTRLASVAGTDSDVLRVSITKGTAELSVLKAVTDKDGHTTKVAATYNTGSDGTITQADDSDLQYVGQSTFALSDFNLADVGALFAHAEQIAGSAASQQLQIVDYNNQQVLMTVTTNPESRTVFFQRDGTPVKQLDFTTAEGLREGLKDAVGAHSRVLAVGTLLGAGLYVDTEGPNDTTNRTLRTPTFPAWTAARNEKPRYADFDPSAINPDVVARVIDNLPTLTGNPAEAGVSVTIDMRDERRTPTMTFTLGNKTVVTDMDGNDITPYVTR